MNDPRAGMPRLPLPRPASDPAAADAAQATDTAQTTDTTQATDAVPANDAVLADDRLIDDVCSGRRGADDPDPLVRLLAAWRSARRRHRRRPRVGVLRCGGRGVL